MLQFGIGVFIVLHGLVHLWLVTLSQRLVPFKPEMGWTGRSWLFSSFLGDPTVRTLASACFLLATLGLAASGIGIIGHHAWWRPIGLVSAALSALALLLFWDGSLERIVEKGLIGFLVSAAIVVAALVIK